MLLGFHQLVRARPMFECLLAYAMREGRAGLN
jgi:hypothetical protein